MAEPQAPSPGDFACVSIAGLGGRSIAVSQWLAEGGWFRDERIENYDHAFIYTGYLKRHVCLGILTLDLSLHGWDGAGHYAAEAEPHGARLRKLGRTAEEARASCGTLALWSTGILDPRPAQRDKIVRAALQLLGTPYSFLDYASLFLHHAHIPAPGLHRYITSSGHMICSQYVDRAWSRGGVQLFADHRWDGDVMPLDLADLLIERRDHPWSRPGHDVMKDIREANRRQRGNWRTGEEL